MCAEVGQRLILEFAGEITDVSGASATRRQRGEPSPLPELGDSPVLAADPRRLSRDDDHQYAEELDPAPSLAREGQHGAEGARVEWK